MPRWLRLARALLVLAVVVAAAGATLVWRLQSGPLSLDLVIPHLKAALEADEAWQVGLDGLDLVWGATGHGAELRARGLRLARPDGSAAVRLDAARIRVRRRALLQGSLVVIGFEIDAPEIRLVRDAGGRLAVALGEQAAPRDAAGIWSAMRRLEHVAVRGGRGALVA